MYSTRLRLYSLTVASYRFTYISEGCTREFRRLFAEELVLWEVCVQGLSGEDVVAGGRQVLHHGPLAPGHLLGPVPQQRVQASHPPLTGRVMGRPHLAPHHLVVYRADDLKKKRGNKCIQTNK